MAEECPVVPDCECRAVPHVPHLLWPLVAPFSFGSWHQGRTREERDFSRRNQPALSGHLQTHCHATFLENLSKEKSGRCLQVGAVVPQGRHLPCSQLIQFGPQHCLGSPHPFSSDPKHRVKKKALSTLRDAPTPPPKSQKQTCLQSPWIACRPHATFQEQILVLLFPAFLCFSCSCTFKRNKKTYQTFGVTSKRGFMVP